MSYPAFNSQRDEIVKIAIGENSYINVQSTVFGGEQDVANLSELIRFKEVTDTIEKISSSIMETLKKVKPDKASVEFGIQIAVEAGVATALLVKGAGTGNLKITLEWGKDKS